MILIKGDNGVEVITEETVLDLFDKLEAELYASRQKHDAFATPDHMNARHLLVKLGRRSPRT